MDQQVAGVLSSYRRLILGMIITASSFASIAHADNHPDLQGVKVVVATENAYPPLQFIDPSTGDAIGWEYDAIRELASRLNFELVFETTSWDTMIPAISEGQYDVGMAGITIRDDRREKVDFSEPYLRSELFMLVRADEDRFSNASEFTVIDDGLIGAQAGTTPFYTAVYEVLDGDEANPRIKLFDTFETSIQALTAGDVDVVLTDSTAGQRYVNANPETFKMVGNAISSEDFGFIFPKGSDLVGSFNVGIDSMRADGTLDALTTRWFLKYSQGK